MVDHRYLTEMSKALHIYLWFSVFACAVAIFVRAGRRFNRPRLRSRRRLGKARQVCDRMNLYLGIRGVPPIRQKEGERMGHGALGSDYGVHRA